MCSGISWINSLPSEPSFSPALLLAPASCKLGARKVSGELHWASEKHYKEESFHQFQVWGKWQFLNRNKIWSDLEKVWAPCILKVFLAWAWCSMEIVNGLAPYVFLSFVCDSLFFYYVCRKGCQRRDEHKVSQKKKCWLKSALTALLSVNFRVLNLDTTPYIPWYIPVKFRADTCNHL